MIAVTVTKSSSESHLKTHETSKGRQTTESPGFRDALIEYAFRSDSVEDTRILQQLIQRQSWRHTID